MQNLPVHKRSRPFQKTVTSAEANNTTIYVEYNELTIIIHDYEFIEAVMLDIRNYHFKL